ncbi:MAG: hypothetical protein DMG32_15525 [Acidobacteria bacterium]|nr:MAG: hypothetical protein DMG32_15525 [Acidobacteriota bacterium]
MSRQQKQIMLLAGLVAVFFYAIYRSNRSPEIAPVVSSADETFRPIAVENPALKLELLERLRKLQYEGAHRNIFSAVAPPPVSAASLNAIPPPVVTPALPSGPAPLAIPATFYGFVTDAQTGVRRAFFMEGESVYIVAVGETLLGRFRLVQIGNSSVELEEISTGRRATLTMEEPNPA